MASKNNILQITTPSFTRVVDVNTLDYTHYTAKKGGEKNDVPGMMAEIVYPQGKVVMTRSEKNHHVIIQNTAFSANSKTKKRKRALMQVEVGGTQDRFFEDGTILHGGGESSIGSICKVMLIKNDDGGQEMNVSFTTTIPPPMPPPQTIPEDGQKKMKMWTIQKKVKIEENHLVVEEITVRNNDLPLCKLWTVLKHISTTLV